MHYFSFKNICRCYRCRGLEFAQKLFVVALKCVLVARCELLQNSTQLRCRLLMTNLIMVSTILVTEFERIRTDGREQKVIRIK